MSAELHMAMAVVEWQVARDHLDAMREAGYTVPFIISGRIEAEQRQMIRQWRALRGEALESTVQQAVAECRAYITEHLGEVEELERSSNG